MIFPRVFKCEGSVVDFTSIATTLLPGSNHANLSAEVGELRDLRFSMSDTGQFYKFVETWDVCGTTKDLVSNPR